MSRFLGGIMGNSVPGAPSTGAGSGVWDANGQYYLQTEDGWFYSPATKLSVPTGINAPGYWDLDPGAQGPLTMNIGDTYDIGVAPVAEGGGSPARVVVHMWGAGGGGGRGPTNPGGEPESGGGGGGYTTGTMILSDGTTYKAVVGNARGNGPAVPWGDPAASGNPVSPPYQPTATYHSGGYSGIFETSVSAPTARLIAGGGGLGGYNDGGIQGAGGGGGGTTGADGGSPTGYSGPANGEGGTAGEGGNGGTSPHTNGSDGTALTGGQGGERGVSGAAGGGGGSGWYGGGGGAGQIAPGTNSDGGGGGGGSSYIHPSITGGSTTQAGIIDAANNSNPHYVSGRAKGGVYTGGPTGFPSDMWGSPGTITLVGG